MNTMRKNPTNEADAIRAAREAAIRRLYHSGQHSREAISRETGIPLNRVRQVLAFAEPYRPRVQIRTRCKTFSAE